MTMCCIISMCHIIFKMHKFQVGWMDTAFGIHEISESKIQVSDFRTQTSDVKQNVLQRISGKENHTTAQFKISKLVIRCMV